MKLDGSKAQLLRLCNWTKQKNPSSYARNLGLSLSARDTIQCLGQVRTLLRADASQIAYPV